MVASHAWFRHKRASYYSFKKLVRSPPASRLAQRSNAVECYNGNYALRNADIVTSSICATSHCSTSIASKSRHVITSWCVENGAWFICAVFWPNHDLKSCLA
jgi:hypothetical protein